MYKSEKCVPLSPKISLFCKMLHKLALPIFVTVPVATTLLPVVALPLTSLSTTWKLLISWMPMMFYASLSPFTCSSAHPISLENPSHLSRSCKTSTLFWNSKWTIVHLLLKSFYQAYSSLTNTSQLCNHLCLSPQWSLNSLRKAPGSYPPLHSGKHVLHAWHVIMLTKYLLN